MDTPLSKSVNLRMRNVNPYQPSEIDVYVPKSFPDLDETGKPIDPLWVFKASEIRYLDALHRGEDPEKAIENSGLSQRQIHRLLMGKKARDYMGALLRQRLAIEGWTQDKWVHEGIRIWEGERGASREQMEAWKELGARIAPKPEKSSDSKERPQIVINLGLAQEALKRQEVIEGHQIG